MKLYSVYERSNMSLGKLDLGACVTEADTRDDVIREATEYYEEAMYDDCERDVILVTYDDDTDNETLEEITLSWNNKKYV